MMETLEKKQDYPFIVKWNNSEGGVSEGPLSLLWNLIESYKVDILDVSLSKITNDFIKFIQLSKGLSIELGTEFAIMAANLLYLKSKALLPDPGFEEENTETTLPKELVEKLLEYKKFQLAGQKLGILDKIQSSVFRRESNQVLIDFPDDENYLDVSLIDLISAFNTILEKSAVNEEVPDTVDMSIEFNVEDKIALITEMMNKRHDIFFSEVFETEEPQNLEITVTFLAILELIKTKTIKVVQHVVFGDIKIIRVNQF